MSDKKDIFTLTDETREATTLYVQYKLDYYRLHITERITKALTYVVSSVIMLCTGLIVLAFVALGAALLIGELLGSLALGLFIMAGAFLCLGLLLIALRAPLIRGPLLRVFIKEIFDDHNIKT